MLKIQIKGKNNLLPANNFDNENEVKDKVKGKIEWEPCKPMIKAIDKTEWKE